MSNLKQCFELLEITPEASFDEAKTAYRDLVNVWHPDKHNHNKRLHSKATEKLKQINAAWNTLDAYYKDGGRSKLEQEAIERAERERLKREKEAAENVERERQERERRRKEQEESDRRNNQFKFSELTVLHLQSGLMWTRDANLPASIPRYSLFGIFKKPVLAKEGLTWKRAQDFLTILNQERYAGYSDWRLPTVHELEKFAAQCTSSGYITTVTKDHWLCKTINTGINYSGFQNVTCGYYWSATIPFNRPWTVTMLNCISRSRDDNKSENNYVWPVRQM